LSIRFFIAVIIVIKERLKNFGVKGYVQFLLKKVEWTWTDGTYYATVKLARRPLKLTRLSVFILPNKGLSHSLYLAFAKLSQTLLLFFIFCGCVFGLAGKNSRFFRPMAVMCLGIMIFLLFWETRSRYLLTMIPVFIVMAAAGTNKAYLTIASYWKREKLKPK
jgi:hypothetical protein